MAKILMPTKNPVHAREYELEDWNSSECAPPEDDYRLSFDVNSDSVVRASHAVTQFVQRPESRRKIIAKNEGRGRMSQHVAYGVTSDARPHVSRMLCLACIIVFVVEMHASSWEFEETSVNPFYGPPPDVLLRLGAKWEPGVVERGQYWRLLTANFLHGGIAHIVFNLLALYGLGAGAEIAHGHAAVLFVFLSTGIFSFMVSCIFLPSVIAVGASGSIFGLLGALWSHIFQNWKHLDAPWCQFFFLFFQTALSLVLGLCPYVDNFCHIGGLCFGVCVGLSVFVLPDFDPQTGIAKPLGPKKTILCVVGGTTAVILFIVVFVLMTYYKDNPFKLCSFCQHFSCYEFQMPYTSNPIWFCGACHQESFSASYHNESLFLDCPWSSDNTEVIVQNSTIDTIDDSDVYELCEDYCRPWY